ncbi:hypothetical protein NQ318_007042 [Aromia moschata]|uniref:Uncharacterized protein n=1 Tax=Aromia moschata TaxID=1265417 RepID=A0AAV8XHN9_9CUCU|nr:hypothetical protein NQ318_007042 [Aromia moschata]
MDALQKIEILQALMAMFIPNVGLLLIILAISANDFERTRWDYRTKVESSLFVLIGLWCVFYCVIGFASNIVFKKRELAGQWTGIAKAALIVYGIHLVLSWLWLVILIFHENIMLALADLVIVNVTGVHLICLFHRVKPLAGYLFSLYIIWLTFVTTLNCCLLIIN